MIGAVLDKSNRRICDRKIESPDVLASKSANIRPARLLVVVNLAAAPDALTFGLEIPIELNAGNGPVAVARPRRAVLVLGRRFANQERVVRPVGDLLQF